MNQISDIKFVVIIEKDQFVNFCSYFELIDENDSKDLKYLLQQKWATKICMEFESEEFLKKYNTNYLTTKFSSLIGNKLKLQLSNLWVREVNHLYDNHLEIEIKPNFVWKVDSNFYNSKQLNNWITQIGLNTNAKIIYCIENFETYHLKWFNNKIENLQLMDIEAFNHWQETFEAIKIMVNNMAAHNTW